MFFKKGFVEVHVKQKMQGARCGRRAADLLQLTQSRSIRFLLVRYKETQGLTQFKTKLSYQQLQLAKLTQKQKSRFLPVPECSFNTV